VHEDSFQTKILLSAIIPITKMAGRFENLKSCFLECTDLPINLILVHDIQDDATSQELRNLALANDHLALKLIEGEYGSPGAARNAGLGESLAPWTVFWDSDDLPKPRTVIEAITQAEEKSELIIGNFSTQSSSGTNSILHLRNLENIALNPGLWRIIFRSDILSETRFCLSRMGEDQLFLMDLAPDSRSIHFSNEIFYEYFIGSPFQLTSIQNDIDEVEKTLVLAESRWEQVESLRTQFSRFILLKLYITTIKRAKSGSKLQIFFRHLSIIIKTNPISLANFIFKFSQRQELVNEKRK